MAFAKCLLVSLSIFALMLFIRKKSDRAIDFYQSENQVKHASESEEKVYELQQQIYGKCFLSKLGHNLNKTQQYLMTLWQHHLSGLTLEKKWIPSIKDAGVKFTTYLEPKIHYLTDKSIEVFYTAKQNWVSSIKYASVTLTTYLEPKVHYLIDKSIEVLYSAKQVLTPDLIQRFDVSYYYLDQANRIMSIAKLHLEMVQVSLGSCSENVMHGFKMLVNLGRKKIRKAIQGAFSSG